MTGQITPHKWPGQHRAPPPISAEDLHYIRQNTLSNIGLEVALISDLIEENMAALSGEFMKLVKYSKQQVDDMTLACDLLQEKSIDKESGSAEEIHKILRHSAEASSLFSKNVNQIIYTMQFQDQTRQVMGAISTALDILGRLSSCQTNLPSKSSLSDNNRNLLDHLITETAQKDLDQNYILRMFLGAKDKENSPVGGDTEDKTDIEFF